MVSEFDKILKRKEFYGNAGATYGAFSRKDVIESFKELMDLEMTTCLNCRTTIAKKQTKCSACGSTNVKNYIETNDVDYYFNIESK